MQCFQLGAVHALFSHWEQLGKKCLCAETDDYVCIHAKQLAVRLCVIDYVCIRCTAGCTPVVIWIKHSWLYTGSHMD